MSSLSKSVRQPTVPVPAPAEPSAPAKSIITFTEVPGTEGGFTLGIALHGAHQQALHPELDAQPVSIVDVLALAVAHTVRTQPEAFRQSVALVSTTIHDINDRLAAGEDQGDVIAQADNTLGGALTSARNG